MKTYFDLISTHSYNMSGPSRRRYCFVKGKPALVEDKEEIGKFRMHTDLFFECDQLGNKLIEEKVQNKAKTFVQFRPEIANREEAIKESNEKVEEERKNNLDVNELLEQIAKDVSSEVSGLVVKKTKKEKKVKNVLECDLCGYIAKNQNDLKDHLDKHSEED